MSFTNGILNLTNWSGNVILPTLAGLFLAIAILNFARSETYAAAMYGGLLCLMASGLLRVMETFASQRALAACGTERSSFNDYRLTRPLDPMVGQPTSPAGRWVRQFRNHL